MEKLENKGEILAVDDVPASLSFLHEILSQQGYSVRTAPNGELALWTAAHRPPDLILLDVRMPGMDGFEVCRRLKADPATAAIPLIFLSADADIAEKVRGFRAGAVDYVGKPFASEEVLQRVATHLLLARVTKELKAEKQLLEERVLQRTEQLAHTARTLQAEVAARIEVEAKLRVSASAFEASLAAMLIVDCDWNIVAANPAFVAQSGYALAECLGKSAHIFRSDRHDTAFFDNLLRVVQTEGKWTGEVWSRNKDGNVFPTLQSISSVTSGDGNSDGDGKPIRYVCVMLDLSEAKDAQTLINFLTRHDALTGLPNRVLVQDRFSQLVSSMDHEAESLAVLCVNLDRFRFINDFHGRSCGDNVLHWMASCLTLNLPSTDSVFRESSDEFIIVHRALGNSTDSLGLSSFVQSLQEILTTTVEIDDAIIDVSVSLGIAAYPLDGLSFEDLSNNARIAMMRAKNHGGASYAFFSEKLDQTGRVRFDLAQRLRHALARNEFEVFYQPQVHANSRKIISAEALLRWNSPGLGMVSPALFIPVAEESGRIVEIGTWVLQSVCMQIARWHAQGHGYVKVAVNLSGVQFLRQDLVQTVTHALLASQIPPAYLELEITESAIIEDVQRAIETMHALKTLGVTISLDDFGTGYSSLSYLKRFPIDYLKIDQSFVRDLLVEPDAKAIVLAIIGLAHLMRLEVVAEGVEEEAQGQFLAANGCDVLQGYLFGKPVNAESFLHRLITESNN
ncbi:MAG: EAL domain-containing protein [Rhodoferax sp.]|nr:EAL domain-containing protein [Rhodoferax sp.]